MTHLSGEISVRKGAHRLHGPLNNLLILTASMATALHWIQNGTVNFKTGAYVTAESNQFDVEVRLPIHGPLEVALAGVVPDEIRLKFVPKKTESDGDRISGFRNVIMYAVVPIFVDFYENSKPWLKANVSTDRQQWPAIWNFGRVIRNATAHGGNLNITNPDAPPVSWHRLSYGPGDDGREVVGGDLSFADMIILMIEMSDELDRLGCPV